MRKHIQTYKVKLQYSLKRKLAIIITLSHKVYKHKVKSYARQIESVVPTENDKIIVDMVVVVSNQDCPFIPNQISVTE